MRAILAFFILWVCMVLRSTIFQIPPINVISPDFVLVVLIAVALAHGSRMAMLLGVAIGLFQDAVFGTFLGLNAFTYGVLGYFAGAAFSLFLHRNVAVTFLVTVVATVIQQWFTFGLTRMLDVTAYTWDGVIAHCLSQMIQNGVLLLLLYPLLNRIFPTRLRATYVQDAKDAS